MNVLILNNVPAPYFLPLFDTLGREPGWSLTVCYTTNWNSTVGWQPRSHYGANSYRTVILDQEFPKLRDRVSSYWAAAIALKKLLSAEKPDYVICYGYTLKPQLMLVLWAILTKTPYALIGDANYFCDQSNGLKRIVKSCWLRFITKKAAALITVGTASRLFWEKYGATPPQLFKSCLVVDNDFFRKSGETSKQEAAKLRSQLSFTDKVVFLYVGRLIKRKNVDLILRAARQLSGKGLGIVIVGSGEEGEVLKSQAGESIEVFFAGNVTPDKLPVFYQMADVLVLPAQQEPWGLVINEAMNCGLAIIAHRHCGAVIDLVREDNGFQLQGFSVEELAAAMQELILNRSRLQAMQLRSQAKITAWSITRAAAGIVQAVETTRYKL